MLIDVVLRTKRAGVAVVPAGVRSRIVNVRFLTTTALVIATAQKVAGSVAVQAVTVNTTSQRSFTITLTANAPAGGMPIAWFVVDTIGTALS